MKTLVLVLTVFPYLASDAVAESLRIATYNVNCGNRRGDQVLDAISAAVVVGDVSVHIINIHLAPVVLKPGDRIASALTALSDAETVHEAEIAAVARVLDPTRPTVVLGDFNSISTFVAPRTLKNNGMVDSFAAANLEPDSHPTWMWPARPVPISLRIDYIFHSQHFSTRESSIIRREGSDHALVVSELSLERTSGR